MRPVSLPDVIAQVRERIGRLRGTSMNEQGRAHRAHPAYARLGHRGGRRGLPRVPSPIQ